MLLKNINFFKLSKLMIGTFVFVVCGDEEHIDTLHFSLRYLRKFSENEIVVLTDSTRNAKPVEHSNIVDVQTPKEFSHHQASIFLKVGIHRHLPKGENYCYLDTDVVAISHEVDDVFNEFIAPIRFAPDHCSVNKFSPIAVDCGCLKTKLPVRRDLQARLDAADAKGTPKYEKKTRLIGHFQELKENLPLRLKTAIRYALAWKTFRLNDEFYLDKRQRIWFDNENTPIIFEAATKQIEEETGLKYDRSKLTWVDKNGFDIWLDDCDHLIDRIKEKFNISVTTRNWQHWNGGVFLFNDESHDFLESWFKKTMGIFEDPQWNTRDQGTLVATAWEFGLKDHPTLDRKWNFIADHYNHGMRLNADTGAFTEDGFRTTYHPAFVHVYHHFGDTDWYIWNWVLDQLDGQPKQNAMEDSSKAGEPEN